jgi:hypothetical protein
LLIGILVAFIVLIIEQVLYKWSVPFLRSKSEESGWKSLKLMFLSQVKLKLMKLVLNSYFYERKKIEILSNRSFD